MAADPPLYLWDYTSTNEEVASRHLAPVREVPHDSSQHTVNCAQDVGTEVVVFRATPQESAPCCYGVKHAAV